jgi:hypothetical protein
MYSECRAREIDEGGYLFSDVEEVCYSHDRGCVMIRVQTEDGYRLMSLPMGHVVTPRRRDQNRLATVVIALVLRPNGSHNNYSPRLGRIAPCC